MKLRRRAVRLLLAVAISLIAGLVRYYSNDPGAGGAFSGNSAAVRAIDARLSNQMVDAEAVVTRILGDDTHGSRHQRLLVDIAGRSVLVAHNIDLAPRVPVQRGDTVRIRGEFEWNEKGGLIHWTHHDPKGRHTGGWIEHRGRKFQ